MPTSAPSEDRVKRPVPPALGLILSFAVAVAAIVAVVAVALIGHRSKGASGVAPVAGGEGRLVAMTWYGAAGQVFGSFRR